MKRTPVTHLVLLPIVFFICIPALFVSQNIQDVSSVRFSSLLTLATFAVLAIFALLTANYFCRNTPLRIIFTGFAAFTLFFIILTGFMLPVSVSMGMVDPSDVPINFRNLIISCCLALILTLVSHTKYRNGLYIGVFIFVVLNSIVSGATIFSKIRFDDRPNTHLDVRSLREISSTKNIFVFSLDGISGSAVYEILAENKQLSEAFHGFTQFSQAVSSSPATSASTAGSLYGNEDFKVHYSTDMELWNSNPGNLITNLLNTNGYQVSTFGIYGMNFMDSQRSYNSVYTNSIGTPRLLNFIIARTITSLYVFPERWIGWFDQMVQSLFFVNSENSQELQEKLEQSFSPAWKKGLTATYLDANDYTQLLTANQKLPIAHFLHFTFTHYPVEFDKDCVYRGDDEFWYKSNQNRNGVIKETTCAIKTFSSFIEKLKTLGAFDTSIVVLKSDHGKPVGYYDQGSIYAKTINEHPLWGYGRYEPFLAIKGWGEAQNSGMRYNTSPVLIDDLAKTICVEALGNEMCETYSGYNLLASPLIIPESAKATMFIVASKRSSYKFDTHKSITVKRAPNIIQNLHEALTSEDE